jgi:choline dehydrogenase-like flavoprotein
MEADYVVVGAGSAGCVVAARLSEDAQRTVALIEAGPRDRSVFIHIPAGSRRLLTKGLVDWGYQTEPDPGLGGRSLAWPRGKVLGGSSSVNGFNFVRGNAADFDLWAQLGCRGWSYADVLPYFIKMEHRPAGDPTLRGVGGTLPVEDDKAPLAVTDQFVAAAQEAGYRLHDFNALAGEGVGYSQMTRRGRLRASTAATYLADAKKRRNLTVMTDATATALIFAGRRCTGVTLRQRGGEHRVTARREVILCGGSINSPQLLQLSGIGDPDHLAAIGVKVRAVSVNVGRNLSDHYAARLSFRLRDTITINQLTRGWRAVREVLAWLYDGSGVLGSGASTASVFCRSRDTLASPDLQIMFTPLSWDTAKPGRFEREPGVTVSVCVTRPDSRGFVTARSADPMEKPMIVPNYFSAPGDMPATLSGIAIARRIFAQRSLARVVVAETEPGSDVTDAERLADFTRRTGGTVFHPVGTCRMGEDPGAVVDSRLRVRGIDGLRVVDAAVMPTLTTGNTNAPVIMIGEKGADMIRQDARTS